MAVTIPPWLNIDPIEPARLKLQANAQRRAAAAAELNAQIARERIQAEQEMESQRLAAQERASIRHNEVLRQTQDQELAQAAQVLQLRREGQAMQADRFTGQLRLKQEAAEREAAAAAKQMTGMRAVQEGLKAGRPLQELMAENATDLFAGRPPERATAALRSVEPPQFGTTPGGQEFVTGNVRFPPGMIEQGTGPITARPLVDAQGRTLGNLYRGARGYVAAPREGLTPEGRISAIKLLLEANQGELAYKRKDPELLAERKKLTDELRALLRARPSAAQAAAEESMTPAEEAPGAEQQGPTPEPTPDQTEEE